MKHRIALLTGILVILIATLGLADNRWTRMGSLPPAAAGHLPPKMQLFLPSIAREPSKQPAPTPTRTSTPGPPPKAENLLNNPNFDDPVDPDLNCSLSGWTSAQGYWTCSHKPSNPSPFNNAARGKVNDGSADSGKFPPGKSDVLWQLITVTQPHTGLEFQITEINHENGLGERRIYGCNPGASCVLLWSAPIEAPFATSEDDWHSFTYQLDLAQTFEQYRLEFYLQPDSAQSGWKFTNLFFSAD